MREGTSESATRMTHVGVRVSADLSQLTMLRALADTVALIADFGIDEVTDIRLALDEIATWLILDAAAGADLDCRFAYDNRCMMIRASTITRSADAVARTNLRWHFVMNLTDTLSAVQEPFDGSLSGFPTTIEFSWVRVTSGRG